MKKFINESDDVVNEMLEGLTRAFPAYCKRISGSNAVVATNCRQNKVSIVTGGGSGHEPLFSGFVGRGLADAVACGNIFASPNPQIVYEAASAVDSSKGILFLILNYAGDNLNFDMAAELLQEEGIRTAQVRIWDDCTCAPRERLKDRRGIAGSLLILKIAGAACDAGNSLEEVVRITEKARDNVATAGLASSPGYIPGVKNPAFELKDDELEFGVGIHGEPGVLRTKMAPADQLTDHLYESIKKDMQLSAGSEVCVLVNGMGATPALELAIVYRRVAQRLAEDNIAIFDGDYNTYCTCQEMAGFSISILRVDDELKNYYSKPCFSPFYTKEELVC
jgi:dihydroxyacetone kinase